MKHKGWNVCSFLNGQSPRHLQGILAPVLWIFDLILPLFAFPCFIFSPRDWGLFVFSDSSLFILSLIALLLLPC